MHVYCAFCKAFSQVILAKPIDLVNLIDTPCSHPHVTILKVRSFLSVQPVQRAKPWGSNYIINLPSTKGILLPRFVFAIWSGVLQGLLVRRDTTICFHINVCHTCSWGPCNRDSIYSWATDLGRQPRVQGFYVSVYYTCAWGGQIRRRHAALRCRPTCNVGFYDEKTIQQHFVFYVTTLETWHNPYWH